MAGFFTRTNNTRKDTFRANIIVLTFVVAHAMTCLLLHNTSFGDGLALTVLTIGMVYCLIRFYGILFDVFLGLAFLSCFAGFYLGTEGAKLLEGMVPDWGIWINVIMTSVVTEVVGLIIILLLRKRWNKPSDK